MSRAIDKRASQEFSVTRFIDNFLVGAFVLNHHQAIAFSMHCQDRDVNFAVENNISFEVLNGLGISADSRRLVQRFEIGVKVKAGLLIKRANLVAADRIIQLHAVVDSLVPGDIALRAGLELRAKRKDKWKVNLLIPQKLVRLLSRKIGCSRLRRQRNEPARQVGQRPGKSYPRSALRRGLGFRQ